MNCRDIQEVEFIYWMVGEQCITGPTRPPQEVMSDQEI